MESTIKTSWKSSPVPSVKEVANESLAAVPPRYVRPDQDSPSLSNVTSSLPQVPVIDMSKLLSPDSMDSELDKFHHAFKEWGFFQLDGQVCGLLPQDLGSKRLMNTFLLPKDYKVAGGSDFEIGLAKQLINHGVSSSLREKLKAETEEFFNLPMEDKKKLWKEPGEIEGFGEAFVVSEEQKLNWSDVFFVISLPTHLRKPNLIPKLPLPFRDTLEAYSAELKILAMKILNQMAKALRMEADDIKEFFEEGIQGIRLNYYPPCPQPELVMGLNPHSDNVGLTILLQLNEMEGLQFKKDGIWVPVKPIPNAFVINIGDMLEIVTNGIYRSNEHRATVNSVKERLSVGTFYSPKIDGNIGPAPSLITPQTPALFKTISMAEYLKGIFSSERRGGSYLDVMRIKNEEESG